MFSLILNSFLIYESYFLNHINLAEADAAFWSMTAKEIVEMDPQQRLALEVVYECLQNSGTTKWRGKNIGTYFGIFGEVSLTEPPPALSKLNIRFRQGPLKFRLCP